MNNLSVNDITERIVPATLLRRNFGLVGKKIEKLGYVVLTVKGKPAFKVEKIDRMVKKNEVKDYLLSHVGGWKGTDLDDDNLWKEILETERRAGTRKRHVRL